ncbi:hypothetical protein [Kitasatospora sp. NPDC059571]|uniref:hypothetical protein n=1 Tax=Kitasatospora sp. NPDC059571 TaxID=3346871 RepID=UPI0036CB8434
MSEDEATGPGRQRRRWARIGAGTAGLLLAAGGAAWALPGGGGSAPAARPPVPSPPAPSAAPASTAATPSPAAAPPSPSAAPSATPTPARTPAKAPAAPTRRATKVPRWQVTPGTGNPNNDGGTAAHPTDCATNAAGQIMTCDPVKTGIPLPRPS